MTKSGQGVSYIIYYLYKVQNISLFSIKYSYNNYNTGCLSQIKHFRMPEMKLGYQLFRSVSSSSWRGELAIFKMV